MRKMIKIVLFIMLMLLVIFSFVADLPIITTLFDISNSIVYIRLVAILGLFLALLFAQMVKRRFEMTQKYRQAEQVLAQSKAAAKRKERAGMLLDEKLKADYERKVAAIQTEVDELKEQYHMKLMALKTQNLQLKDAVSKLMRALNLKKAQSEKKGMQTAEGPSEVSIPAGEK